jgi:hypothetical protein
LWRVVGQKDYQHFGQELEVDYGSDSLCYWVLTKFTVVFLRKI